VAKIQFGLVIPSEIMHPSTSHRYMEDLYALLNAVKGAYDSVWCIDHLQSGRNDLLEGWTALTYLSALYPEFRWGHSVLCQSFRNPALVAKMVATLQFMSSGRCILGMGAGWDEVECRAYGYAFPTASTRVEELDEALHIIKSMWTQERTTFAGQHYHVEQAWCQPKLDPLPTIMIGAFKPKMLRLAARHADWWNVSSTSVTDYRKLVQDFERACELEKRDPKTVRRTWCGGCACAPTTQALSAITNPQLDMGEDFIGTPHQMIEQMQPFIELGVDHFMLDCSGFPNVTTVMTMVEEVIPALNAS
jgi:alkanesulfonate monooxygenase SsuD/methylene tetrahydromethanopterin reductase-like flavin-dependent oxidoreductase (luciferase family)